eukprot:scaffold133908_cov60-Phaeocystis_antarctica.AAC.3
MIQEITGALPLAHPRGVSGVTVSRRRRGDIRLLKPYVWRLRGCADDRPAVRCLETASTRMPPVDPREELAWRVQKAFSGDHHGHGDARLSACGGVLQTLSRRGMRLCQCHRVRTHEIGARGGGYRALNPGGIGPPSASRTSKQHAHGSITIARDWFFPARHLSFPAPMSRLQTPARSRRHSRGTPLPANTTEGLTALVCA